MPDIFDRGGLSSVKSSRERRDQGQSVDLWLWRDERVEREKQVEQENQVEWQKQVEREKQAEREKQVEWDKQVEQDERGDREKWGGNDPVSKIKMFPDNILGLRMGPLGTFAL